MPESHCAPGRPPLKPSLNLEMADSPMRLINKSTPVNDAENTAENKGINVFNDSSPSINLSSTSSIDYNKLFVRPQLSPTPPDMVSAFLSEDKPAETVSLKSNEASEGGVNNGSTTTNVDQPLILSMPKTTSSSTVNPRTPNLTLPHITSLGNKKSSDLVNEYNDRNNNRPSLPHLTSEIGTSDINKNNFYVQLLEDVKLDDQSVMYELVDRLVKIRLENEELKEDIWNKITSLDDTITQNGKCAQNKPNSLLFDPHLSNADLRKLLQEQRIYNEALYNVINEYQDSFNEIMDSMVLFNKNISNEMIESIKENEELVETQSDKMWESWHAISGLMDDIAKFEKIIVSTFESL